MNFSRKALTLALAGMVGAGFTSVALADSAMTQDANGSTGAYSSDATHSAGSAATNSSTLNDTSAPSSADQGNRATAPQNAPAARLPANRGQNGDTSSTSSATSSGSSSDTGAPASGDVPGSMNGSAGMSGASGSTNGNGNGAASSDSTAGTGNMPGALNQGTRAQHPIELYRRQTTVYLVPDQPGAGVVNPTGDASGTASGVAGSTGQPDHLIHNDVENPDSVIGPAGGLRSGDQAAMPGADTSAATHMNAQGDNVNAQGSTDVNAQGGNASAQGSTDANAQSNRPDENRLPANRTSDQTGKGSLQNGGLSGPSSTTNSRGTTSDTTTTGPSGNP